LNAFLRVVTIWSPSDKEYLLDFVSIQNIFYALIAFSMN